MANEITYKGVLVINGKEVENTFNSLKRASAQLERELKKLPAGSEEYVRKSKELEIVSQRFQDIQKDIAATKKSLKETAPEIKSFGDLGSYMADKFTNGIDASNLSIKSLGKGIKVFAAESWAAIGSIPLVGWLAAIAAGIGIVLKQAVDYNKEISPLLKFLDNLGLDKKILPQLRAISEAFGVEAEQIADTLDNLVDGGIVQDQVEALNTIKVALAKAPDKNELITYLNNTGDTAKKLGLDLNQLIRIKQDLEGTPMDPQKVFGAMEAFTSRILSQSEKIIPTLERSFGGDFSKKLYDGLIKGTISYSDALIKVYQEGEKLKISDKERADVAKALFGKAAGSAYAYNEVLSVISNSHEELNSDLTESQARGLRLADEYENLHKKMDDAFNSKTIRAFTYDFKILMIQAKTFFYDFISGVVNGTKLGFLNVRDTFLSLPSYTKTIFKAIGADLMDLWDLFGKGSTLLSDLFTFKFDKIDGDLNAIKVKFQNSFKNIANARNQIFSDFGVDGRINQRNVNSINNSNAAKAEAADLIEPTDPNRDSPYGLSGDSKAPKGKNPKNNAEAEAKKRQQELEQQLKAEQEAYRKNMALLFEYQEEKAKAIEDDFIRESQLEVTRRNKQEFDNKEKIVGLEKEKLTVSITAKKSIQDQIDTINKIEEENEKAHTFKMLKIQQDADTKRFDIFVQSEQNRIEKSRAKDEEEINDITTLSEAKAKLVNDEYLKLTDLELRTITSLEDAKAALRESANRKMLQAQLDSLEAQKKILEESLKGLTGEAAEKLKADLDQLYIKITQIKSAVLSGGEADDKKATDERRQELSQIDILGFSADQWKETFSNLDTTKGKLEAAGIAFKALGNAVSMFSQLQKALGEREMKNFEKQQNKKKTDLLKNLNEGYLTQEDYHKQLQLLEAQTANKKAEIEYKQAKADKIARMLNIVGDTAAGVAKALPNIPLAIIVGAMGAAQLGIAAAQPLPERQSYLKGGRTKGIGIFDESGNELAGAVHAKEYVIPEWLRQDPVVAKMEDYIEAKRTGATKSFADGGETSDSISKNQNTILSPNVLNPEYMGILSDIRDLLQYLKDNGIIAEMVADAKTGRMIEKASKLWQNINSKNTH